MRRADLDATAATLVFFSLGMFGWGAQYILARGFYATRNTLVPAIVGTVLTFANLPVYWLLVRRYQHLGLAMASSLGITVYTVILFFLLNRRTHNRAGRGLGPVFPQGLRRFRRCRLSPAISCDLSSSRTSLGIVWPELVFASDRDRRGHPASAAGQ